MNPHIVFVSVPMRGSGCHFQQHPVVLHNFFVPRSFSEINLYSFPSLMNILGSDMGEETEGEQVAHDS